MPDSSSISRVETSGRLALVVDDDFELSAMLATYLRGRGWTVETENSADDAQRWLEKSARSADVVVTDLNLGDGDGLLVSAAAKRHDPELPVVIMTAFGSITAAVKAIQQGAYDFVTKPFDLEALGVTLDRAVEHRQLQRELSRLRKEVEHSHGFGELLGSSPAMREVYALLERIADSDASVLITGESGTGKELVARALHHKSVREKGPFIALNCGAVPENLLESELFGHVKGAFTDARSDRAGVFREANGGTLFLDEVGELPASLQVKLLRALQERKVRPVGGEREVPFDARILSATNVNLDEAVEQKRFRQDLFYRLDVVRASLPPLRERGNDVLVLAQAFWKRAKIPPGGRGCKGFDDAAQALMLAYDWPGNVRELGNCVERCLAMVRGETITAEDLPPKVRQARSLPLPSAAPEAMPLLPLVEIERRHIAHVMTACEGNKRKAAQVLGIDRATLYRKLGKSDAGET